MSHQCRCAGEDHPTFGACVRAKHVGIAYSWSAKGQDFTAQKRWDKDLYAYATARAQGIQPDSTSRAATEHALKESDRTGTAYGATD